MNKKDKKVLDEFVCEYKRVEEQDFASTFSGNPLVELFFILENNSYTDGKHIVLDPHMLELFCDDAAWIKTIKFMEHTGFKLDFTNRYLTLSWITKALNIHESSHILYTNFPSIASKGNHGKTFRMLLATVSNIVEDSFIDAKALENYSNSYAYIYLLRVLSLFRSRFLKESTVDENLENINIEEAEKDKISDLLHYYSSKYIYPMFKTEIPEYLEEEIKYLTPLFEDATRNGNPDKRDELSIKIADYLYKDVMKHSDEDDKKENAEEEQKMKELQDKLKELLIDFEIGTGSFNYGNFEHKGLKTSNAISVMEISIDDLSEMLNAASDEVYSALNSFLTNSNLSNELTEGYVYVYENESITKDKQHKGMLLKEILPPVDVRLKPAYDAIKGKYKININSYNRQFTRLLKEKYEVYGSKKIIGAVLSSKNFADPKERFWKQKEEEVEIPNLAITFMLDGSGSMSDIIDDAKKSLIIVHETLKKYEIKHSVVLHQAIYGEPEIQHYILLPFNAKKGQEYSILKSIELENTREGLSLLWNLKYYEKLTAEHKIVVMISDGVPYHEVDEFEYGPPKSMIDARNARMKLESLGFTVIAIALHGCYDELIQIYDTVIDCSDITKLTGKLLQCISNEIAKY